MNKKIKDPIYGYIEIEKEYLNVLNSSYFQRLRNIIQTSYVSIYPSSLHNRFTHSLGVYWLGRLSFDSLIKNSPEITQNISEADLIEIKKTFVFACLCHDLGHSPFSHTGEVFYDKIKLSKELDNVVNEKFYSEDLKLKKGVVGKEHEIMSALLFLNKFPDAIDKKYYSLFARCIIGLQYVSQNQNNPCLNSLLRSCVELLNSSIIDVDKLDYLIRDSYMSGYDSVKIDYERLLNGVFVNQGDYPIGYKKSALSVLETVLTAHDMERRWIQSHPIVLYEAFLLRTIIREISGKYNDDKHKLFSFETLTEEGQKLKKIGTVRLLSDGDILYLAKQNFDNSDAVKEYCDRALRRHPIWKSEAEYSALSLNTAVDKEFWEIIKKWENLLIEGKYDTYSLNEKFYKAIKKEIQNLNQFIKKTQDGTKKATCDNKLKKLKTELKILDSLKKYLKSKKIDFDLVLITGQQFKSNIYKQAFKNIPIKFSYSTNENKIMKDVSFIPLDCQENKNFFYLFYKRNENEINVEEFSKELRKTAII